MQVLAAPDVDEWDQRAAQFTLWPQIVDRVGVMLEHPAAQFLNVRTYIENRDETHKAISADNDVAKSIVMRVFNGMRIPQHLSEYVNWLVYINFYRCNFYWYVDV